jgi:hypothetical protein
MLKQPENRTQSRPKVVISNPPFRSNWLMIRIWSSMTEARPTFF